MPIICSKYMDPNHIFNRHVSDAISFRVFKLLLKAI